MRSIVVLLVSVSALDALRAGESEGECTSLNQEKDAGLATAMEYDFECDEACGVHPESEGTGCWMGCAKKCYKKENTGLGYVVVDTWYDCCQFSCPAPLLENLFSPSKQPKGVRAEPEQKDDGNVFSDFGHALSNIGENLCGFGDRKKKKCDPAAPADLSTVLPKEGTHYAENQFIPHEASMTQAGSDESKVAAAGVAQAYAAAETESYLPGYSNEQPAWPEFPEMVPETVGVPAHEKPRMDPNLVGATRIAQEQAAPPRQATAMQSDGRPMPAPNPDAAAQKGKVPEVTPQALKNEWAHDVAEYGMAERYKNAVFGGKHAQKMITMVKTGKTFTTEQVEMIEVAARLAYGIQDGSISNIDASANAMTRSQNKFVDQEMYYKGMVIYKKWQAKDPQTNLDQDVDPKDLKGDRLECRLPPVFGRDVNAMSALRIASENLFHKMEKRLKQTVGWFRSRTFEKEAAYQLQRALAIAKSASRKEWDVSIPLTKKAQWNAEVEAYGHQERYETAMHGGRYASELRSRPYMKALDLAMIECAARLDFGVELTEAGYGYVDKEMFNKAKMYLGNWEKMGYTIPSAASINQAKLDVSRLGHLELKIAPLFSGSRFALEGLREHSEKLCRKVSQRIEKGNSRFSFKGRREAAEEAGYQLTRAFKRAENALAAKAESDPTGKKAAMERKNAASKK